MAADKGRKRFTPHPAKIVESLTGEERRILESVLGRPSVAEDVQRAWLHVQEERIRLAKSHLAVAELLNGLGTPGLITPEKRSVISRAYYATFCAARAALSFHLGSDRNDHQQLPLWLRKAQNLGPEPQRNRVSAALSQLRNTRNQADYSPFYPEPLGADARYAVREAKAAIRLCTGWLKQEARSRGQRSTL
ncbi:MAG: HEPN domain-containing protein [Myxococcales bacterium]|nr:HEPN domain-containing protein [Myxococcales bacterium]